MATLQSIFCRGVRNPHLLTNPLLLVTQPFLDFLTPPPPPPVTLQHPSLSLIISIYFD